MGSNYADQGDYWIAYSGGCLIVLAVLAVLIGAGVGYALGWRAANRVAQSRRARFRTAACASVDKALKEALVARDEMAAVSARRLVDTVNHRLRPLLRLSEPLTWHLNAVDHALRGKGKTAATPAPTFTAQPTAPVPAVSIPPAAVNIVPAGGSSGATSAGGSIVSPLPIVSTAPRQPAPDERPSERDLTVPERDEAVRKALVAFEAFWKKIDAPTVIENAQKALLGDGVDR